MNQLASIRVALVNGQLIAKFSCLNQLVDIRKIKMRVNALGEHVQPQCHQINISGALAIAK